MKTIEDYNEKLKALRKELEDKRQQLSKEYAFGTAKFKVGDIIKDSTSAIKITKLQYTISFDVPQIVYYGVELKKDFTPRKDGSTRSFYGNDMELVKSA